MDSILKHVVLYGVIPALVLAILVCLLCHLKHRYKCLLPFEKRQVYETLDGEELDNGEIWRVEGELGRGAFGRVNLVQNQNNGKYLARKEILLKTTRQDTLDKVKQEVNILKRLKHPNIVKIFDEIDELSFDRKYFYIYMEYAIGGTLRDVLIYQQIITELKTKDYSIQLIDALSYIHSQNVIHRDLKPANILVLPGDILKLADFGVSKSFNQISVSKTAIGTPHYTSKEVWEGCYGRKCDIWSLGIIIFKMVTGNVPWKNKDRHAIMYDVSSGDLPDVDTMQVSTEMKKFLKRMFLNERERPSADQLLQHPWLSFFKIG